MKYYNENTATVSKMQSNNALSTKCNIHRNRFRKINVPRNVVSMIKYANFQLYSVYPTRVIWRNRHLKAKI